MALDLKAALYIKRVPTKENLADDPSRERYGLLQQMQAGKSFSALCWKCPHNFYMQARKVEAVIDERFLNAQAWYSLRCTAHSELIVRNSVNKENVFPVE